MDSYLLPLLSRLSAYSDLSDSPSKLQIRSVWACELIDRCVHIALNAFIAPTNENFGFVNAIVNAVVAMQGSDRQVLTHRDRLLPSNEVLQRLATLCSQLLHQRLQVMKSVDVTYNETIRLPALYYASLERPGRTPAASNSFDSPQKESRKTELSFLTPEKSSVWEGWMRSRRRLSTSSRGVSEEGDTPIQLRNMSPIEKPRKRPASDSKKPASKRRKSNSSSCSQQTSTLKFR